jgi:hypothetical protein
MGSKYSIGQILTLITSGCAVLNTVYTAPALFNIPVGDVIIPFIQAMAVPIRVVLVIILQSTVAWSFGLLFRRVLYKNDLLHLLAIIVIAPISAWVTIFNIQYVLMGKVVSNFGDYLVLFISACLAGGLSALFIYVHFFPKEKKIANFVVIVQSFALGLIFIATWF